MADLFLVCPRAGRRPRLSAEQLRRVALRLTPDGAELREVRTLDADGLVAAITDPSSPGVLVDLRSDPARAGAGDGEVVEGRAAETGDAGPAGGVALGGFFGDAGRWHQPGAGVPEGTYALVRWDADRVELLADICATRTLWYALTDDLFLASTSQRALVALLGSFELDRSAIAWSLTSGSLGPEASWDARVRRVPPDTRVTLDRRRWSLRADDEPVVFAPEPGDEAAHVARLRAAIEATCCTLGAAPGRWVLPLSGGGDSRALLAFLVHCGVRPRCVTWTTHASLRNPLSDASIARLLARRLGVEHDFLFVDDTDLDAEVVVARFVAADEGRNDEIGAYADGFAMWRDLRAAGVDGIIRGDEPFGHRARAATLEETRRRGGGVMVADYPEGHLVGSLGLTPQTWPERLAPAPGEALAVYDVRLDQTAYVPIVLAGLNGPKARYVGIVNPLLARRVVDAVRSLPPPLLAGKRAFTRVLRDVAPPLPMARFSSSPSLQDLFAVRSFVELLVRDLLSPAVERVVSEEAALRIVSAMVGATTSRGPERRAKTLLKQASVVLPVGVAARIKPAWRGPDPLSAAHVALRVVLASRTIALMEEDARCLASGAGRQ